MAEVHRCLKEAELGEMKTEIQLVTNEANYNKSRIKCLEKEMTQLASIDKSLALTSLSLESMTTYIKQQDANMADQGETLRLMNENLRQLNQGHSSLSKKVDRLEERVVENEHFNTIDLRELNKGKQTDLLKKYAGPMAVGVALGAIVIEILKLFN